MSDIQIKPLEWFETRSLGGTKLVCFDMFGNEFARIDDPHSKYSKIEKIKKKYENEYRDIILRNVAAKFKYCVGCDGHDCDHERGCAYPNVATKRGSSEISRR